MKKGENNKIFKQKKRLLKKIFGTKNKPRLSVFRSNNHIYAQLIDDLMGNTLGFSSTLKKILFTKSFLKATQLEAFLVGKDIAYQAELKGIKNVIFDKGTNCYHGLVKSLADGARKGGLLF